MLILLGIVILLISFVIALVSMIREQREIENHQPRPDSDNLGAPNSVQSTPNGAPEEKLQARGIDVLKSRIEQLTQEELAQQKKQSAAHLSGQITSPDATSGTISVQELVKKRQDQGAG